MNTANNPVHTITAGIQADAEGHPKAFLLKHEHEEITLHPGKAWQQLDTFKWVTRGVIDEPRGFHVLPNGSVELHGEHIELGEPASASRLEERISAHFAAVPSRPERPARANRQPPETATAHKATFRVRIDKLGHLMVASQRNGERTETGIRGLETLVRNGLMLPPKSIHLDPLLRFVEVDGARFESNPSGAAALENRLNALYAPKLGANGDAAIEIRPNPAAASGFDIRFWTLRAGARLEVKGHMSQDYLDLLQDTVKCPLLRPGTLLRLSPPLLIIRRRRPDGGEEKIPELPDLSYLHVTAAQLQRVLNHPLIRRDSVGTASQITEEPETLSTAPSAIRVLRNPETNLLLALQVVQNDGVHAKAFTHHNLAELQQTGTFRPELEVALSPDNRTLTISHRNTNDQERFVLDGSSPNEVLERVSAALTAALKEPAVSAPLASTADAVHISESSPPQKHRDAEAEVSIPAHSPPENPVTSPSMTGPAEQKIDALSPLPASRPPVDPAIEALFAETDPVRVNLHTFRRLEACLSLPRQDVQLSLERVFSHRQFEILSFTHPEITDVLEIRSDDFIGFYLSHINERRIILDYAHLGRRVEWGPDQCFVQLSVAKDPEEFPESALRGMALLENSRFVFVVTPAFKKWMQPRQGPFELAGASFVTVEEVAAHPEQFPLIWPLP